MNTDSGAWSVQQQFLACWPRPQVPARPRDLTSWWRHRFLKSLSSAPRRFYKYATSTDQKQIKEKSHSCLQFEVSGQQFNRPLFLKRGKMLFGPQGLPAELSTNLYGDTFILDFPNAISPNGLIMIMSHFMEVVTLKKMYPQHNIRFLHTVRLWAKSFWVTDWLLCQIGFKAQHTSRGTC